MPKEGCTILHVRPSCLIPDLAELPREPRREYPLQPCRLCDALIPAASSGPHGTALREPEVRGTEGNPHASVFPHEAAGNALILVARQPNALARMVYGPVRPGSRVVRYSSRSFSWLPRSSSSAFSPPGPDAGRSSTSGRGSGSRLARRSWSGSCPRITRASSATTHARAAAWTRFCPAARAPCPATCRTYGSALT